jgi:hypothetical protein
MYANFGESIIQAINAGGMPNIESSWKYLCI